MTGNGTGLGSCFSVNRLSAIGGVTVHTSPHASQLSSPVAATATANPDGGHHLLHLPDVLFSQGQRPVSTKRPFL